MPKRWVVAEPLPAEVTERFPNIPPVLLHLLQRRGLQTQEAIDEFLHPDYSSDLHDPLTFTEIQAATGRVYGALERREKVAVYGDYDADGVSASTVLVQSLRRLGLEVEVYIPHRDREGYGLNEAAVGYLADRGAQLIVTVDCGTTNSREVALAAERGMDVIVTDHHLESQQRPAALAVINPNLHGERYPYRHLAGVGVAFKFVQALLRDVRCPLSAEEREAWEKWLLDLVAIGTVADMVPLVGENRTLVHYGLVVLRKTKRPGLRALAAAGNFSLETADTTTVGFQIGPRLNAAGRMDHATGAYVLLSTEDRDEAATLAEQLQKSNVARQTQVEQMVQQALRQLGEVTDERRILFAHAEGWPGGLVGLVASKLCQTFHRPAFALGSDGQRYIGSGRSIPGFDITAAMARHGELLVRFGGHAGACGCTVAPDRLPDFIAAMEAEATGAIQPADLVPALAIDLEVKLAELTWAVVDQLALFEPFGSGNPKPLLVSRNLEVVGLDPVGRDNSHLRIHVRENGQDVYKTISFGTAATWGQQIKVGSHIDLVYEPGVNEWNGNRELQLKVVDWQPATNLPSRTQ